MRKSNTLHTALIDLDRCRTATPQSVDDLAN